MHLSNEAIKILCGIILGLVLMLVTITYNPPPYILLIVFFANIVPAAFIHKLIVKNISVKKAFIKNALVFYSTEFITWVVTYDLYVTLINYLSK